MNSLSRRRFLVGATGLAAAGGLFGIGDLARAAHEDRTTPTGRLRIGYLPITDAAPLLVAHGAGLYAGVGGVEPVLFRSWASLAEAFMTRQVDVVHLLMPMAIQLRYSAGTAARALGWNHTNGSALTVAPEIADLEQLAGHQVAIPFWWSIHNIAVQALFRAHGLTPVVRTSASKSAKTVELVVMSPADMVPALANRSIAAFTVADPFNAAAEIKGIGRIHRFLGDVWRDHACCTFMVHEGLIDESPALVQALTDGVVGAQVRINEDRTAAASLLSAGGYLPQALPAITKSLTYNPQDYSLRHPDWAPQRIGYQPFPFPSFTHKLVESMHDTIVDGDTGFLSKLDPAKVHADLFDDGFVRTALSTVPGTSVLGLPAELTRTEKVDLT